MPNNPKEDKQHKPSEVVQTGLKGKLLIAGPTLDDPDFHKSVIFICEHDAEGAMGFVINKTSADISLSAMLDQLEISDEAGLVNGGRAKMRQAGPGPAGPTDTVRAGGPCRPGHGFVVFPTDTARFDPEKSGIELIDEKRSFSNDIEFLRALAAGKGPEKYIILLGFAGWEAGQLEQELQENAWLHTDADDGLIYAPDPDAVWDLAIAKTGIDPARLSLQTGSA